MSSVSFRIVSLPREIQTSSEVAWYVEEIVRYGAVESVDIISNVAANGARFSSAIVNMAASASWQIQRQRFIEAGKSGLIANSYYTNASTGEIVQFCFDNGKPMLHIKHVLLDAPVEERTESLSNWTSLYIPVIPNDIEHLQTEENLKQFFEQDMQLGSVNRVDFVSRSIADSALSVRSAYVHFNSWSNNQTAVHVREQIDGRGEFKCVGYYEDDQFKRFANRRFMVLKMNRSPIPQAAPDANIHQLAARNAQLEALVEELNSKLIMLETMNDMLKEKLGESQVEAACLWNVMAEEQEDDDGKGPMTMEELMV
jgi:hypothetical protein